jgi:type 2 lantibiotic biosynthesis protein LanM
MTTLLVQRAQEAAAASVEPWMARAATMSERLDAVTSGTASRSSITPAGPPAHELAQRWRATCAAGDDERFARRLGALGFDADAVAQLGEVEIGPLPWMAFAHAASARAGVEGERLSIDDDTSWAAEARNPFAAIWRVWADVGAVALSARGHTASPLTESLIGLLDRRVAHAGLAGVYERFVAEVPIVVDAAPDARTYRCWVRDHLADGFARIFDEIPVWGRAMAVLVEQWVDAADALLRHLAADRTILEAELGLPADVEITEVTGGGDRHHDGREVLILTAADGRRVVYKPRSIAAEVLAATVATHLRSSGGVDVDLVPAFVDRGDHGWAEHIESVEPESEADRQTFSRRAGAALAFARVLGISDLHYENILLARDRPVLVDLECIGHPVFRGPDAMRDAFADSLRHEPLVRSGLLPDRETRGEDGIDVAGLAATRPTGRPSFVAEHPGTDRFRLRPNPARREPLPAAAPLPLAPILEGFEHAMTTFAAHGIGAELRGPLRTRIVPQGTSVYSGILREALRGRGLRDGLAFSVELEAAAAEATAGEDGTWRLALADAERHQLERLDIPVLESDWRDTGAWAAGRRFDEVVEESGLDVIRRVVDGLGAADTRATRDLVAITWEGAHGDSDQRSMQLSPSADVRSTAAAIGAFLVERVVTWRDGTPCWYEPVVAKPSVEAARSSRGIYDGTTGIAVFLAALASTTGDEDASVLARRIAHTATARTDDPSFAGGRAGIGWARVCTGRLLDDPQLVVSGTADLLAAAAHPDDGAHIDWIGGGAGIVLALAGAARATGSPALAAAAEERARRLRSEWSALVAGGGHGQLAAVRLSAAHGITGIALAAAAAHAVRGDAELGEWARTLVSIENDRIDRRGGVPARLSAVDRRPDIGWCWGVAGHLVNRRALAELLDGPALATGVDEAIAIAGDCHLTSHRLCCGLAGVIEALPDGTSAHRAAVDRLLAERRFVGETGTSHPGCGLFRGIAGVGLTLLRVADPTLPNVLVADLGRR